MKLLRVKLLVLSACCIVASCTGSSDYSSINETDKVTDYSLIKNAIEVHILNEANDPSSYSFADMEIADTVSYNTIIENELGNAKSSLEFYESELKEWNELSIDDYLQDIIKRYEGYVINDRNIISVINNFKSENETMLDEIAYFEVYFSHRENNIMGALELFRNVYQVRILSDEEVEIIWSGDRKTVELLRNDSDMDLEVWMELSQQVFTGNAYTKILEEIGIYD